MTKEVCQIFMPGISAVDRAEHKVLTKQESDLLLFELLL